MTLCSGEEILRLDNFCDELLYEHGVRFAGIVNKYGFIQAGGFKPGVDTFEMDHKRKMMDDQIRLSLSMEQDFDNVSFTQYTLFKQRNVSIITIPIEDEFLVISTESFVNTDEIISIAKKLFTLS